MHSHYFEYRLPDQPPFSSYRCPEDHVLGPLSLINLFVGPNNSGKSRLLRHLFTSWDLEYTTRDFNNLTFRDFANKIKAPFDKLFASASVIGRIAATDLTKYVSIDSRFLSPRNLVYDEIVGLLDLAVDSRGGITRSAMSTARDNANLHQAMSDFGKDALRSFEQLKYDQDLPRRKRFYIPILRGMRPFDDKHKNIYKDRTNQDYFDSPGQQSQLKNFHNVFTGLELYNILKAKLLGEPEDRDAVRKFETFLSKNFFDSRPIALIPREGRNTVHVKIGNEKQLPLYELGDGLQNLIIITFNAFLEHEPCLFFIEEPDLCMHPGLQRALIETLATKNQHQYYITTHSNHLLDMTLDYDDLSVFLFRKIGEGSEAKFSITPASTHDNNVLRDLGVRNSSVFLTNATIWVEGITDRLYLRAYMKKYIKELEETEPDQADVLRKLKEDYHYSFVEYQGSNLTHWSFDPDDENVKRIKASFICGNSFLLADGDVASKGDRVAVYKEMLGENFVVLECKEIENLIPLEALRALVKDQFSNHASDVNKLQYSDYSKLKKGLGLYLDDKLKLPEGKTVFAVDSGTIKNKVAFCEKAIKLMSNESFSWWLTPKLKDLCKKIFAHIQNQNQ